MTAPERITVTFDNWRNPNAGAAYKNDAGETAYVRADLVDPVSIREAALREAADHFSGLAVLRKMWSAAEIKNAILTLIPTKGTTK